MPSEYQSNCGETHACCNERLEREGGKARCCYCVPHDNCKLNDAYDMHIEGDTVVSPDPSDTHADGKLRPIREYLEDVTGVSHGDSEVESAWLEHIEDFIVQRERAAQLALIERLRTHGHGGGNWRRLLDEEAKKLDRSSSVVEHRSPKPKA